MKQILVTLDAPAPTNKSSTMTLNVELVRFVGGESIYNVNGGDRNLPTYRKCIVPETRRPIWETIGYVMGCEHERPIILKFKYKDGRTEFVEIKPIADIYKIQ
jgi:hypothetical protein